MTHEGQGFALADVALEYKPAQPELPIVLGVKGPRALGLAGAVADGVVCSIMSSPAHVRRVRETIAPARRQSGRGPCPVLAYVPVAIGRDGAAARRSVRPLLARYLAHLHGQTILAEAGVSESQTLAIRAARARGETGAALVTEDQIDAFAARRLSRSRAAAARGLDRGGSRHPHRLARRRGRPGRAAPTHRDRAAAVARGPSLESSGALRMRFGVHIPTCIEGMMYPVPFAKPADILPTAHAGGAASASTPCGATTT